MSDSLASDKPPFSNSKIIIIVVAFWGVVVIALLTVFLSQNGRQSPRIADNTNLSSSDTGLQTQLQPSLDKLDADPNDMNALLTIADKYLSARQADKAKIALERTLVVDPKNVDAMVMMGEVYESSGQNQKAKESFDKALSIDPNSVYAMNAKAVYIANVEKHYQSALGLLNEALKQKPEASLAANIKTNIEEIQKFSKMGIGGRK